MKTVSLTILCSLALTVMFETAACAQHPQSLPMKDSASVTNGDFHYQVSGAPEMYTIKRRDSLQTEINTHNGEQSVWRVRWQDPCNFTLNSVSVNRPWIQREEQFWKAHQIVVRVIEVTGDYYIFQSALDSLNSLRYYLKDTA